jgi:hypothetical protein
VLEIITTRREFMPGSTRCNGALRLAINSCNGSMSQVLIN